MLAKTEIIRGEGVFEGRLPYCGANGYLKIIKDGYGLRHLILLMMKQI